MLEYRQHQAKKLREIQDSLKRIQNYIVNLPPIDIDNGELQQDGLIDEIGLLYEKLEHRYLRVSSPRCRIAVIGLEKQGKSTFVNAWVGQQALPSDTKRCTWASSTIINGTAPTANIRFASSEKIEMDIDNLFADLGVTRTEIGFPLSANVRENEKIKRNDDRPAFQDLEQLSRFWDEIRRNLNRGDLIIKKDSIKELYDELFNYISLRSKNDKEQGLPYAVEHVDICFNMTEKNIEFAIDDLPGIDAPGNRAENMTWEVVEKYADVIVLVKNAFNNASLNSNEIRIWDKARNSDSAIKLTDRLFVILNQSDAEKVEHGRDCHQQAFNNFKDRDVPENRIFYCSSRAELYKKIKEGLSFTYLEEEYERATQRIGRYKNQIATTGFPEFTDALYSFLETDFSHIEERAYNDLAKAYDDLRCRVQRLIDAYSSLAVSEKGATQKEQERFAALWSPSDQSSKDIKGLRTAILKSVNNQTRNVIELPELRDSFLDGIKQNLEDSKQHFLESVTVDNYLKMDLTGQATALRSDIAMKSGYYAKVQWDLKEEIQVKLAQNISRNINGSLHGIWESTIKANSDESDKGLCAVSEEERNEFFLKNLKNCHSVAFSRIFNDEILEKHGLAYNPAEGFSALLKSISQAPSEYLFMPESKYDADRSRLLRKAQFYKNTLMSDNKREKYERIFADKEDDKSFAEAAGKNLSLVRELVDLFLPKPFSILTDDLTNVVQQKNTENPFMAVAAKHEALKESKSDEIEEAPDILIANLRKRVEAFYYILSAMLFDNDFGFIGYYRAVLEEFRRAIESHLNEGGIIRALAYRYREQIWSNELEFKKTQARKQLEQILDNLIKEIEHIN